MIDLLANARTTHGFIRLLTLFFANAAAHANAQTNDSVPTNIIFILADGMSYADLGCYGAEQTKTPIADRMAADGMRFTSFYTYPVYHSRARNRASGNGV